MSGAPRRPSPVRTESGFTLIELLVVIGVIGLLAVALLPNIIGAGEEGKRTETIARINDLKMKVQAFERQHGFYPPDDFSNPNNKFKLGIKTDSVNQGIESLVMFLSVERLGRDSLADNPSWLANTDEDKNTAEIPLLETASKMEVVDAWGMPIAYFASDYGGYSRQQRVLGPDGEERKVDAATDRSTGKPLGRGKFQLISAGPDGDFSTWGDNISYPERIE